MTSGAVSSKSESWLTTKKYPKFSFFNSHLKVAFFMPSALLKASMHFQDKAFKQIVSLTNNATNHAPVAHAVFRNVSRTAQRLITEKIALLRSTCRVFFILSQQGFP